MENTSLHEREEALLRSIDRVLNSRLTWDAIEGAVSRWSTQLDQVRAALAAQRHPAQDGRTAAPPQEAADGSNRY